jgi:hypothetical protein
MCWFERARPRVLSLAHSADQSLTLRGQAVMTSTAFYLFLEIAELFNMK